MLAHNVSWVFLAWDVGEVDEPTGNCFSDKMEGQHVVLLVQLGMNLCWGIDNSLIVTKDITLVMNGNAKVTKTGSDVNDLLNASSHCQHFTAVSGNLNRGLLLGEPIQRGCVEEVKDASDRVSSHQVMHKVCIDTMGQHDMVSQGDWSIIGQDLLKGTINSSCPIQLFDTKV